MTDDRATALASSARESGALLIWADLGQGRANGDLENQRAVIDRIVETTVILRGASGNDRVLSRISYRRNGRYYLRTDLVGAAEMRAPAVAATGYTNPWWEVLVGDLAPVSASVAAAYGVAWGALNLVDKFFDVVKKGVELQRMRQPNGRELDPETGEAVREMLREEIRESLHGPVQEVLAPKRPTDPLAEGAPEAVDFASSRVPGLAPRSLRRLSSDRTPSVPDSGQLRTDAAVELLSNRLLLDVLALTQLQLRGVIAELESTIIDGAQAEEVVRRTAEEQRRVGDGVEQDIRRVNETRPEKRRTDRR